MAQNRRRVAAMPERPPSDRLDFSAAETTEMDRYAVESGINLWVSSITA